jgi:hypothetical protein
MKALGMPLSNRTFLWPVIVTAAFFLVFLGMRAPSVSQAQKPKLRPRAVVENQIKAAQSGVEKSVVAVDLCRRAAVVEPPLSQGAVIPRENLTVIPAIVSLIPSRAPPVSPV